MYAVALGYNFPAPPLVSFWDTEARARNMADEYMSPAGDGSSMYAGVTIIKVGATCTDTCAKWRAKGGKWEEVE